VEVGLCLLEDARDRGAELQAFQVGRQVVPAAFERSDLVAVRSGRGPRRATRGTSRSATVIDLLNARLADAIDLQTQCKQAHWNVKGPTFIALYKLFDEVNDDVEEYVDLIAERAVQLGGVADGTARSVAKRTTLAEYAARGPDPRDHVQALSSALSTFCKAVRAAINKTADLGDADTADVFTEISRGADKWLWMVEAHISTAR